MTIKVSCACGAKFNAPDKLAGKRAKCPKCGNPLAIGEPLSATELAGPADDDDPLGLGDAAAFESHAQSSSLTGHNPASPSPVAPSPATNMPTAIAQPAAFHPAAQMGVPGQSQMQPIKQAAWGQSNWNSVSDDMPANSKLGVLDFVTCGFGIVHAMVAWSFLIWWAFSLMRLGMGIGLLLSPASILLFISIAASTGIGIASVTHLLRVDWAAQLGFVSSLAYFGVIVISFGLGIISLISAQSQMAEAQQQLAETQQMLRDAGLEEQVQIDVTRMMIEAFVWSIPRYIVMWVGPILFIVLYRQRAS